ncbi:unnamed protein product [Heligmosomoides polygyrus]|uniref:CCDC92 domain-containing protein n=1 Tax=Heligmosomoides polygyrus TaxID=6339 RepID=A0A183GP98_HELPZ|nr:unnamed protein product [Heligmosomoides polygyrus]
MDSSVTPLAAPNPKRRRPPPKRPAINTTANSTDSLDLQSQVSALLADESIPVYLRSIISLLLQERQRHDQMMEQLRELVREVAALREENSRLKASLELSQNQKSIAPASPASHPPPSSAALVDGGTKDDPERARSVVICGIPESAAQVPSVRVIDDFNRVRDIMDFLSINCSTISAYRMGRFEDHRQRGLRSIRLQIRLIRSTYRAKSALYSLTKVFLSIFVPLFRSCYKNVNVTTR